MLKDELHLHLHGCLSAEDVWKLGQSRWESRRTALTWYADEYEKAWGRRAEWEHYWTEEDGLSKLKKDYEFLSCENFARFQACFNLLIALFPLDAEDDFIPRYVLEKYAASGLEYAEFRTPFGMRFVNNGESINKFLSILGRLARDVEFQTGFQGRFVISLPRDSHLLEFQYGCLRDWLEKHRDLARFIVGIDFCGFEEKSPPHFKKEFLKKVHTDNARNRELALAILYHVGETFESMDIEESIRWIRSVHEMGVHRLGHCISLGLDPVALFQRDYSEERVEQIYALQKETLQDLRSKGQIIESCPRSNVYVGNIRNLEHHPLKRFVREGMNVVISSDDPGIFNTSLREEENFAMTTLGLNKEALVKMAKIARSSRSEILAGRV